MVAMQMLEKMWHEQRDIEQQDTGRRTINKAFNHYLRTKISRYPKTHRQYRLAFKNIISEDYTLKLDHIEKDIHNYIKNTSHSPVTVNTYLTLIQGFVNYCSEQGWLRQKNFKKLYRQKVTRREPEPYTDAEVAHLLEVTREHNYPLAIMLEFMVETGARVIDCLTLTKGQIRKNSIIWSNKITKAAEERPVSARALILLSELPTDGARIFPWRYSTASRLSRTLAKMFERAGIDRNGRSFQEFRSTFRMRLIKKGVPEIYIEYLLRHSRPDITAIHYTSYKSDAILSHLNQ
jgi:integrase